MPNSDGSPVEVFDGDYVGSSSEPDSFASITNGKVEARYGNSCELNGTITNMGIVFHFSGTDSCSADGTFYGRATAPFGPFQMISFTNWGIEGIQQVTFQKREM
ncbi:hypothetical protein EZMO1_1387 [Endozoicomonas montiporae CL-33]|uniref:Uncharacterized protein n=1 Tax=Endozoicomonas montiporae CL-33 TaxID=570277 RepID=A0A142B9Z9_9GAMM|nr:hypothetical protein [Endozoicomonas montiporae]AMO55575.1 hypothetical protein EZMO1_1387 [Endozoicomonas montiporae CL-33]